MRTHYDFSKMKARRNPYLRLLKQSVTIRLDRGTVDYFRALATKTGLPYQNLINLYLRDCVIERRELSMKWALPGRRTKRSSGRSALRAAPSRRRLTAGKTTGLPDGETS